MTYPECLAFVVSQRSYGRTDRLTFMGSETSSSLYRVRNAFYIVMLIKNIYTKYTRKNSQNLILIKNIYTLMIGNASFCLLSRKRFLLPVTKLSDESRLLHTFQRI